jgi:hypothetical protein
MQPPQKYMAAFVPRFIRSTRLSYIPINNVIGSKMMKNERNIPMAYDLIMLPEMPFMRMKLRLGSEDMASTSLSQSNLSPAFSLKNILEIVVPSTEANADAFAKAHFLKQVDLG